MIAKQHNNYFQVNAMHSLICSEINLLQLIPQQRLYLFDTEYDGKKPYL